MQRKPVVVDFPVADVKVDRDVRQRGDVLKGIDQLATSISQDGQIHPITVKEDGTLVAGERRLEAVKSLGHETIRAQIFERLSYQDAYRIELQENIARRNLPWQEECRAVAIYHQMKIKAMAGQWTMLATANDLGISKTAVARYTTVGKSLGVDGDYDQEVVDCHSLEGAMNLIRGRAERANAAAASRGIVIGAVAAAQPKIDKSLSKEDKGKALLGLFGKAAATPADASEDELAVIEAGQLAAESLKQYEQEQASAQQQPVITASFTDWVETYEGPAFDVLHVDFPWGKGYAGSNTRRTGRAHVSPTYADTEDVHWDLLEALLTWQDKLALPVAHMVYWFDHEFYQPIKDTITNAGWHLVQPHPLIWHKPYQGVAADTKRRPRHTYEAAFLFSRGDRKLVKLDQDVFVGRKEENLHINQKSHDMLCHFLGMLVDENTALFDPTCGSGSSLVAARHLGSPRVLGVEIDEANADVARGFLQRETAA